LARRRRERRAPPRRARPRHRPAQAGARYCPSSLMSSSSSAGKNAHSSRISSLA
jgi:hypothetical protein